MNHSRTSAPATRRALARVAFSLVELLLVMAVIGLLLAMILPAISRTKLETKKQMARLQMAEIAAGLASYQSVYGRFPVSTQAFDCSALVGEDITYGGRLEGTDLWLAGPCYLSDNSELMAGLLDLEEYGDGTPTINCGHVQNPRRTKFLDPLFWGGTNAAPGVGIDGAYRDPWGSPYIISLDLNADGRARDILYREAAVSQDPNNPQRGLRGFVKVSDERGRAMYEAPGPILVWSPGPDRHVSFREKANAGVNRDNLLTCER